MNPLERIAEERLQEAIRDGLFDDLPGSGEPLELEDLSRVPDDLRAGYMLLKGSGHLPEEMQLKKELLSIHDLLSACHDEEERGRLRERRGGLALRLAILMEKRGARLAPEYLAFLQTRRSPEK